MNGKQDPRPEEEEIIIEGGLDGEDLIKGPSRPLWDNVRNDHPTPPSPTEEE